MNDKIGTLAAGYVWLFALGAVLLGAGSGYLTAGMDAEVGQGVFLAIFAGAGFASTLLTKAKALVSVGAFLVAAFGSAATYYVLAAQAMAEATGALGAAEAGGVLGAAVGAFVAVITFLVSATGGIGGALAGMRVRKQAGA
ncbi:MAG TPA: hypothetical protein RMH99_12155 [Sandaracinaceae bacterium LLY-WYZ-13_1]|nr:hypothetical protein [Sandaracinaceae bacterium LLY-WYZ-13_1]